jgi:hypothetical protein
MTLSPIFLYAYNRPSHLREMLESLKKNPLAAQSRLIVHSDGPKNAKDVPKIGEVRRILRQKQWAGTMQIIEHKNNIGLKDSGDQRLTNVINKFGRSIVLQDDFVLARGFLKYMNDALTLYEKENKVMHISGYMYPGATGLPGTFFLPVTSIWGFATWKRAWKYLESDANKLVNKIIEMDGISRFDMGGAANAFETLKKNADGVMYSFDIYWYASVFIHDGLALHPKISMVRNIGNDGSGANCGLEPDFLNQDIGNKIEVKKIPLTISNEAIYSIKSYFDKKKSLMERIRCLPYSTYNRFHNIYRLLSGNS